MRISLIVAMAENHMIGRDEDLPWRISADLRYFKRQTIGHPVVMGRKTFQTIGGPLPDRTVIVITRDRVFEAEGAYVTHSLGAALDLGREIAAESGVDEVLVAGGAQIYALALGDAKRIYMTEIHRAYEGDAVFPEQAGVGEHHVARVAGREGDLAVGVERHVEAPCSQPGRDAVGAFATLGHHQ